MCNCRQEIEKKLLKKFQEESPEAKEHSVELMGYALIFGDTLKLKGCMPIKQLAQFPLKKGGFKKKEVKLNMMFTYCPFCGVKYD